MRMLRWLCDNTRKGEVRNEYILEWVGVVPIEDKLRENRLRWFGHTNRGSGEEMLYRDCR
mgnify:CR=1 FL=1